MAILEYNTGGKQSAITSRISVLQIASKSRVSYPNKRLWAAIENDDVLAWGNRIVLTIESNFHEAIAEENQREPLIREKVDRFGTVLHEVRDE